MSCVPVYKRWIGWLVGKVLVVQLTNAGFQSEPNIFFFPDF